MNIERILSKIPPPPPMTPEEFATARAVLDISGIHTEIGETRDPEKPEFVSSRILIAIHDGERVQVKSLHEAFTMATEVLGTDGGQP